MRLHAFTELAKHKVKGAGSVCPQQYPFGSQRRSVDGLDVSLLPAHNGSIPITGYHFAFRRSFCLLALPCQLVPTLFVLFPRVRTRLPSQLYAVVLEYYL
jgi:hypothetical protein